MSSLNFRFLRDFHRNNFLLCQLRFLLNVDAARDIATGRGEADGVLGFFILNEFDSHSFFLVLELITLQLPLYYIYRHCQALALTILKIIRKLFAIRYAVFGVYAFALVDCRGLGAY